MWKDIKDILEGIVGILNAVIWGSLFVGVMLAYFGKLVIACNNVGCMLMLK